MVKFDIEGVKYSVPSGWKDVTYDRYLSVVNSTGEKPLPLLSAMSGIPEDVLANCPVTFGEQLADLLSFYHDGSIEAFAVTDKADIDIKALPYRHFEFANIQIKNWWNALYPEKKQLTEFEVQRVYLNAVPEIIKDYTEGIRDRWEKDKTIQKRLKKAVGEAPEILDISDKPIPAVYDTALFFCGLLRSSTLHTAN